MYKCKICESRLKKSHPTTRKKIISNKVWRYQTFKCVADPIIKRSEKRYSAEELTKEYYVWFCSECGFEFDGTIGIINNTTISS